MLTGSQSPCKLSTYSDAKRELKLPVCTAKGLVHAVTQAFVWLNHELVPYECLTAAVAMMKKKRDVHCLLVPLVIALLISLSTGMTETSASKKLNADVQPEFSMQHTALHCVRACAIIGPGSIY